MADDDQDAAAIDQPDAPNEPVPPAIIQAPPQLNAGGLDDIQAMDQGQMELNEAVDPPAPRNHVFGNANRDQAWHFEAVRRLPAYVNMRFMNHFRDAEIRLGMERREREWGQRLAAAVDDIGAAAAIDQADAPNEIVPPAEAIDNANQERAINRPLVNMLMRAEGWNMDLEHAEGLPQGVAEWRLEMNRRERELDERFAAANAAEEAARQAVQAVQAERERVRADDRLLEMQIRLAEEQQQRARAEVAREAAEARLLRYRLEARPIAQAAGLAPPPAAPEAHREMQERLAARRANRRQQLLDVVGRERAEEVARPVIRPVPRQPRPAAAEEPARLPALQWDVRERNALRMLHRRGADQQEREAYVQALREQRRQYEEHRLAGGPPPAGLFMPLFGDRGGGAPRPPADVGDDVAPLVEQQPIDAAAIPPVEAPQPVPQPIAALLRQLVEAVDGAAAAVGARLDERAIEEEVAAMGARFPPMEGHPEEQRLIENGLRHLAGVAQGRREHDDAVAAAANAAIRPPRNANEAGAALPPADAHDWGPIRGVPFLNPLPMEQLEAQRMMMPVNAGVEIQRLQQERIQLLHAQARRQLNLLQDRIDRNPRRPLEPAVGGGNVHVFDLGAAFEQFQDREERLERERVAAETQRAAWNEEREANDLPENLALRYSRACCVCHKENPRRRAVMVACGHCCVCLPCAEEMAGGRRNGRIDCLICRARTGFVRLYEDLEHEMAPRGEGGQPPEACQTGDASLGGKRKHGGDDEDQGPSSAKQPRTVQ